MTKAIGILIILLAVGIGVVPRFTECSATGHFIEIPDGRTIPMKCHWTSMASILVATPLLAIGGLVIFSRRGETLRVLFILGAILGAGAILLPTSLIGVCSSDLMMCNIVMKPALIFSGIVTIGAGMLGLLIAGKGQ